MFFKEQNDKIIEYTRIFFFYGHDRHIATVDSKVTIVSVICPYSRAIYVFM